MKGENLLILMDYSIIHQMKAENLLIFMDTPNIVY